MSEVKLNIQQHLSTVRAFVRDYKNRTEEERILAFILQKNPRGTPSSIGPKGFSDSFTDIEISQAISQVLQHP